MKLFTQDLYNSPASPSNIAATATRSNTVFPNFLNFFQNWNLGEILIGFNNFTLLWSVFVSTMFVADFYFYYVKQGDSEIAREKVGQKALWTSARIWWRYLPGLFLTILYVFVSGIWANLVAILGIAFFVIKLWKDLYDFLGITTYFDWYNGFSGSFRKFLSLKVVRKKGKK